MYIFIVCNNFKVLNKKKIKKKKKKIRFKIANFKLYFFPNSLDNWTMKISEFSGQFVRTESLIKVQRSINKYDFQEVTHSTHVYCIVYTDHYQ